MTEGYFSCCYLKPTPAMPPTSSSVTSLFLENCYGRRGQTSQSSVNLIARATNIEGRICKNTSPAIKLTFTSIEATTAYDFLSHAFGAQVRLSPNASV